MQGSLAGVALRTLHVIGLHFTCLLSTIRLVVPEVILTSTLGVGAAQRQLCLIVTLFM